MGVIRRLSAYYCNDLRLSSKLLISHLSLIVASVIVMLSFFGSTVYNLLIDTTISAKQQTAFATAVSVAEQLDIVIRSSRSVKEAFYQQIGELVRRRDGAPAGSDPLPEAVAAVSGMGLTYQIYLDEDYAAMCAEPALRDHTRPQENIFGTYWYGIASCGQDADSFFCPGLYLSPQEVAQYGDLAYVEVLNDSMTGRRIGYMVAYFSQEPIIRALEQNLDASRGASYIINSRDALVCDSDAALVGAYYTNSQEVERIVADGGNATYLGTDIIVGSYPVSRTDWKIVSILPKSDVLQEADRAVKQFFCIYGVVAALSALLAITLARSISGRIATAVNQIGRTKNARLKKINSLPHARDEVGQLVDSYNGMIASLNDLMDREAEAAKALRLSEFKALQAQINPHFLYNSLDMMNWLARAGEMERVSEGIQALGKFYKLTLSKRDTFGTVAKETEHAALYVKLQNMRYEDRISFVVDLDENIQDCVMPKLVFQPLVENAILHGIMERPDKQGEVLLAGWREGDDLQFLLSDNGVGMTPAQIEKLMHPDPAGGEPGRNSGTNIGIYNTHERLQLYYGPQYGLRYESTPGVGTEVHIRIPYMLTKETTP